MSSELQAKEQSTQPAQPNQGPEAGANIGRILSWVICVPLIGALGYFIIRKAVPSDSTEMLETLQKDGIDGTCVFVFDSTRISDVICSYSPKYEECKSDGNGQTRCYDLPALFECNCPITLTFTDVKDNVLDRVAQVRTTFYRTSSPEKASGKLSNATALSEYNVDVKALCRNIGRCKRYHCERIDKDCCALNFKGITEFSDCAACNAYAKTPFDCSMALPDTVYGEPIEVIEGYVEQFINEHDHLITLNGILLAVFFVLGFVFHCRVKCILKSNKRENAAE